MLNWVWCSSATGTQYRQGQAVYPDQVSGPSGEYSGVFPDGTPFTGTADRKPHYVFVWKTWGKDSSFIYRHSCEKMLTQ